MLALMQFIRKTYRMAGAAERRVVLGNFASLTVLQAITYILPVVILPYLFRALGPEKFGLIAFAQAFVQYFSILTDYGFGVSATREISLCRDEHAKVCRIFSSVMTVKLLLALISLGILAALIAVIPRFTRDWPVYLLSFGVVLGNTLFPLWFFQGTEKMRHIADLNIIGGFLYAGLLFLLVKGPGDYLMVPLVTSAVSILTGLLGQFIAFNTFGMFFKFPGYRDMRRQVKAGWDVFVSNVAINAYTTTRVFVVGLLTSNTLTGFYSIAEKVANLFQTFPLYSFSQALFPRLSAIYRKNRRKAYKIMQRIQQITVTVSLVFLPLALVFSRLIVRIACGGDYPETVLSLRLLLIAVFFVSSNAFRVQFLLVCGKTRRYSLIHVTMALVGLPLIVLLISSFSYAGAAMATICIEAGIFTLTYLSVKKLSFS